MDGESTDANHQGWSDALEVTQGYLIKATNKRSRAAQRKAVQEEDFIIVMELDKAGVKVAEASLKGDIFPTVQIEFTAVFNASRATYYRYELSNVRVTSYHLIASGNSEDGPPLQEIGLEFEIIKVTYSEFGADGNLRGKIEYEWNVAK